MSAHSKWTNVETSHFTGPASSYDLYEKKTLSIKFSEERNQKRSLNKKNLGHIWLDLPLPHSQSDVSSFYRCAQRPLIMLHNNLQPSLEDKCQEGGPSKFKKTVFNRNILWPDCPLWMNFRLTWVFPRNSREQSICRFCLSVAPKLLPNFLHYCGQMVSIHVHFCSCGGHDYCVSCGVTIVCFQSYTRHNWTVKHALIKKIDHLPHWRVRQH